MAQEKIKITYSQGKFYFSRMSKDAWHSLSPKSDLRKIERTEHEFSEEILKKILGIIIDENEVADLSFVGTKEMCDSFNSIVENQYLNRGIESFEYEVDSNFSNPECEQAEITFQKYSEKLQDAHQHEVDEQKRAIEQEKQRREEAFHEESSREYDENNRVALLSEKEEKAKKIILGFIASTGATGAIPIPFADTPFLISQQIAMLMAINKVFDISLEKGVISTLVAAVFGVGGAAALGRATVSGILKMVPFAGSIVGGAISAGTAGLITGALGNAYLFVCKSVYLGDLSEADIATSKGTDMLKAAFKENMKNQK